MAWAFSSSTGMDGGGSYAASISLSYPSVSSGDLLVAVIQQDSWATTFSSYPSGWTFLWSAYGNYSGRWWMGYKICTGSESGNATWSWGSSRRYCGSMAHYTGIDSYDTSSYTDSSLTSPSVTPANADSLVILMIGGRNASTAYGVPSGATLRREDGDTTYAYLPHVAIADFNHGASATGTKVWTSAATSSRHGVLSFVAAPAAGGGGGTNRAHNLLMGI